MRVAGVPFKAARVTHGAIAPTAGVLHRTYGRWAGDMSVGLRNPGGVGFHFLIGKTVDQWVQFADTTAKCWHAGGWPNSCAVGIEFEGRNEERLTDWQVRAGAWVIAAVSNHHRIPMTYHVGARVGPRRGWLSHSSVAGSDHTDLVTMDDWQRMAAFWTPSPAPVVPSQPDVDWAAVRRFFAGMLFAELNQFPTGTVLKINDFGPRVATLQRALNLVTGSRLVEDGKFGPATALTVAAFQKFFQLTPDGVFGDKTRNLLGFALMNIRDGRDGR